MQGGHDLTQQSQGAKLNEAGAERRDARAQRILDAASTVIMRYGYHKTTIEDIAREAGVRKGTLYLHWSTRDALFSALILREKIAMAEDMKQRIARDRAGATLRGVLKHAALALMQRPLLRAVLLRDTEVFGKLVQREQSSELSTEVLAGFTTYLESLREQGLVRADLSLQTLGTLFSSIFLGFFLAAPLVPKAFTPADEELAELMAETGSRTLEPRDPLPSSALQIASQTLTRYLDQSGARAQERLDADVQAVPENEVPTTQLFARVRGSKGGRPKKLTTAAQVIEARRMYADKTRSREEICSALGISRATFYRYIKGSG